MADWVKCSSPHYADSEVWVNLDQVVSMETEIAGTKITYAGGDNLYVSEHPNAIIGNDRLRNA